MAVTAAIGVGRTGMAAGAGVATATAGAAAAIMAVVAGWLWWPRRLGGGGGWSAAMAAGWRRRRLWWRSCRRLQRRSRRRRLWRWRPWRRWRRTPLTCSWLSCLAAHSGLTRSEWASAWVRLSMAVGYAAKDAAPAAGARLEQSPSLQSERAERQFQLLIASSSAGCLPTCSCRDCKSWRASAILSAALFPDASGLGASVGFMGHSPCRALLSRQIARFASVLRHNPVSLAGVEASSLFSSWVPRAAHKEFPDVYKGSRIEMQSRNDHRSHSNCQRKDSADLAKTTRLSG